MYNELWSCIIYMYTSLSFHVVPPTPPILYSTHSYPNSMSLNKPTNNPTTKVQLVLSVVQDCEALCWSVGQLLVAKNDCPSPSSPHCQELLSEHGAWRTPSQMCWDFGWLGLVHVITATVSVLAMPESHCTLPSLLLLQSSCFLLCDFQQASGGGGVNCLV